MSNQDTETQFDLDLFKRLMLNASSLATLAREAHLAAMEYVARYGGADPKHVKAGRKALMQSQHITNTMQQMLSDASTDGILKAYKTYSGKEV